MGIFAYIVFLCYLYVHMHNAVAMQYQVCVVIQQ
jgi:hypothetical protein